MFKNRTLQVKMVKDNQSSAGTTTTPSREIDPEQINEIAKDQIKTIAVAVGATLITAFLASGTKEIAVHTAKTKIR